MISRRNLIQHACPTCDAEYWFAAEKAGHDTTCNNCNSTYPVPIGLPVQLRDVNTSPRRPLTAEETEAFYASPAGRAYLAGQLPKTGGALARRTAPSELAPESCERMPDARYPVAPHDDDKKVKLSLGKWIGMEVDTDGKTRSAMATTFLGGLLVALGAIIAAKFGFKSRA